MLLEYRNDSVSYQHRPIQYHLRYTRRFLQLHPAQAPFEQTLEAYHLQVLRGHLLISATYPFMDMAVHHRHRTSIRRRHPLFLPLFHPLTARPRHSLPLRLPIDQLLHHLLSPKTIAGDIHVFIHGTSPFTSLVQVPHYRQHRSLRMGLKKLRLGIQMESQRLSYTVRLCNKAGNSSQDSLSAERG